MMNPSIDLQRKLVAWNAEHLNVEQLHWLYSDVERLMGSCKDHDCYIHGTNAESDAYRTWRKLVLEEGARLLDELPPVMAEAEYRCAGEELQKYYDSLNHQARIIFEETSLAARWFEGHRSELETKYPNEFVAVYGKGNYILHHENIENLMNEISKSGRDQRRFYIGFVEKLEG